MSFRVVFHHSGGYLVQFGLTEMAGRGDYECFHSSLDRMLVYCGVTLSI